MKSSVALCFLATISISPGRAYGQQQSDATLQTLLNEVRQLRLALERSAVVAPKIQVTLQRMQLQQEQVTRLSRQLEDVRNQLAHSGAEAVDIGAQLKVDETRLASEQDATRRKQIEEETRMLKLRLEQVSERQSMQATQQQARESELAGRLQTEHNKLNELNDRLTGLERMLDGPPKQ
jgi:hypothetical protein